MLQIDVEEIGCHSEEFKCHHVPASRFNNQGVITCLDCGASYIDIVAAVSFPLINNYQKEEFVI